MAQGLFYSGSDLGSFSTLNQTVLLESRIKVYFVRYYSGHVEKGDIRNGKFVIGDESVTSFMKTFPIITCERILSWI